MRFLSSPMAATLAAFPVVMVLTLPAANAQKTPSKGTKPPAKSTAKPAKKDPWAINFAYKKQNIPSPAPVKNYARAINRAGLDTNKGLEPLMNAHQEAEEKPALLSDPAWKKRLGDACTDLTTEADKMLLVQPVPKECQPIAPYAKDYVTACKQYATHFKARLATLKLKDFDSLDDDVGKIYGASGDMGRTMLLVLSQYTDYDEMFAEFDVDDKKRTEEKPPEKPL